MNPHSLCVLNWILCDRQTQTFIDIFLILFLLFGFIISFWWRRRQLMPHSLTPSRYTRKTMLHTRHSCFWLVSPFCTFLLYISYFCYVVFPLSLFYPLFFTMMTYIHLLLQFDDDNDDDDDYILCYPHPLNLKWNLSFLLFFPCFLYTLQWRRFLSHIWHSWHCLVSCLPFRREEMKWHLT